MQKILRYRAMSRGHIFNKIFLNFFELYFVNVRKNPAVQFCKLFSGLFVLSDKSKLLSLTFLRLYVLHNHPKTTRRSLKPNLEELFLKKWASF